MSFVVEDGSGVANANSYVSAADAVTYFTDRGKTALAATATATLQVALVLATDYIDSKFSFNGTRVLAAQTLSWPRSGAADTEEGYTVPTNVIPSVLKRAVIELAGKILEGAILLEDQDRGGMVSSLKVGPISLSYEPGASPGTTYAITGLLKGLIASTEPGAQLEMFAEEADPDTEFAFTPGHFDNGR